MTRLGKACLCDDRHHDCDHPDQWCGRPIGGEWSPYFCVPCDRVRMSRIGASLEHIARSMGAQS
jgi:hypothetical protein